MKLNKNNNNSLYVPAENRIISAIKNCIYKYNGNVKITDNYFFNMKDTVNTITLYSANKFISGDIDENGNKKYFYNVLNPLCDNASKNIDIDRKNIEVKPIKNKYRIAAAIYNNELRNYMAKTKFGLLLNDIVWSLPRDGSVILQKEKDGTISKVELRHAKMDPAVSNKKASYDLESDFFFRPRVMNLMEFDEMYDKGWNQLAIDEITNRITTRMANGPTQTPDINLYECYIVLPNNLFKDGAKGYDNYLVYVTLNDEDDAFSLGLERVLYFVKGYKMKVKKLDYRTVVGRALGLGLMESGFDAQERFNEMQNQLAQAMRTLTKTNYQTRDRNFKRNIATDSLDGEVFTVNSELTIVPNEKRDLASFNQQMQSWMENLRMNAQANEVLTGETMPSDTPYRTVQQLSVAGGKFFDLVREDLALFLDDVITDWILPDFEKELKKKKEVDIVGADLWKELVDLQVKEKIDNAIIKYVAANGRYPMQSEIDALTTKLTNNASKDIIMEIKDNFFDFEKKIFIDISGESVNIQRQTESLINALTMIVQNPASLQDPTIWKVFSAILENTGIGLDIINQKPTTQGTPEANVPTMAEAGRNLSMAPGGAESNQINSAINE